MKILLILAAIAELKVGNPVRYPIIAPPLTLLLLEAICKQAQHEVELIDIRLLMKQSSGRWVLDYGALESLIAQSTAEVAGISFLSSAAEDGFLIAALCKKYRKTVVGGGLHTTVALQEFIANGSFHYLIQGEAEELFPSLLRDLEQNSRPRFPDTPIVLPARTLRDMEIVPPIRDYSLYGPVFEQYTSQRSIFVETSRGCFKSCTFCEVAKTGAAWSALRQIPLETVFQSIEHAVTHYQINYLVIADSIATAFKSHFLKFVSHISHRFPGITVQFNSTVDCWDEERAKACQSLACSVWFGFESGSQRILEIIKKGTSVERSYRAAQLCRQYGLPCAFNVLLGVPGETEEDYLQTMEVFEKCPWVYPNPNIFNPLPGTDLYRYCLEHGLSRSPNSYDIWDAERIEQSGEGPVKSVDYILVLKYYRRLSELQNEPQRSLSI